MVRCADCGANFTSLDRCRSHVASVHLGWLDYHCLYCLRKGVESRFGGQHEVQEHIRTAHQQQEYAAVCMQGSDKTEKIDAKIISTEKLQTPEPEIIILKEEVNRDEDEIESAVPFLVQTVSKMPVAVSDQMAAPKQEPPEAPMANNTHTDIKPELILIEDDDDFEPFPSMPVLVPAENESKTSSSEFELLQICPEDSPGSTSALLEPQTRSTPSSESEDMQRYMAARPLDIIELKMQRFLRRRDRPWTYTVEQTDVNPQKPQPKSLARYGVRQYRARQAACRLLYITATKLKCDRLAEKEGANQCTKVMHALGQLKQGGNMYVVREAVSAIDPLLADLIVQTAIFWQVPNDNNYRDVAMEQLKGMRNLCSSSKHRRSRTAAAPNTSVLPTKRPKRSTGPPGGDTCC